MNWLDALHLLDSSFPTGAYVHSFGLETLAPKDLEAALLLRLQETLARLELIYLRLAYSVDLLELDENLDSMLLMRESREASSAIGTGLLRSACELVSDPRLSDFQARGRRHHQPVAFGALAASLGLPQNVAGEAYSFNSLRSEVSAAQRLGWLGQREAQRMLHRLKAPIRAAVSEASQLELCDAGAFSPAWDIASMRHEWAGVRMFAS